MIRHIATFPHPTRHYNVVPGSAGISLAWKASSTMLQHIQHPPDMLEACGVLVGRVTHPGGLVIDSATPPGPLDIRGRTLCHRCDPSHQEYVDRAWAKDKVSNFVGDWHTHSDPIPVPSELDLLNFQKQADDGHAAMPDWRWMFIILGTTHMGLWEATPCQP